MRMFVVFWFGFGFSCAGLGLWLWLWRCVARLVGLSVRGSAGGGERDRENVCECLRFGDISGMDRHITPVLRVRLCCWF